MSMTFRTLSWRMCVGIVSLLAVAGCGDANVHDQLATLRAKEAAGFGRIRSSVEAQGGGPLHAYAREGLSPFSVTWAVTSAGKDVNAKDNRGQTPLHLVAMHAKESQTLDVAARLIHHGANVNVKDSNGQTPLHLAAMHAKESRALDVVAGLIHHGANVNAKDSNGQTPLHLVAVHAGKGGDNAAFALAKLLVRHGANVNARDRNSQTPLHLVLKPASSEQFF